jgi:hypothetical protein
VFRHQSDDRFIACHMRLRDEQNDETHDRRSDENQKKRQMPPHGRHWLMRIDCELNADVDPGRRVVVRSDFAFEPETVFHRVVAA